MTDKYRRIDLSLNKDFMFKRIIEKLLFTFPASKKLMADLNNEKKEKEALHNSLRILKNELNTLKSQKHPDNTWIISEIDKNILLWVELNDMGVSHPCINNDYEPIETNFIKSTLKEGMTFVDIGANIGWFSLIAAKLVGSSGKVYAYEPRSSIFERLSKSIELNNFHWVEANNYALGDSEKQLQIGWGKENKNLGGTWLITSEDVKSELKHHDFEKINVQRLDNVLQDCKVDLVKIDIEGAEYLAIKGAEEMLLQSKPIILSEISPTLLPKISRVTTQQYISYMEGLSYECYALTENGTGSRIFPDDIKSDEVINVVFLPKLH